MISIGDLKTAVDIAELQKLLARISRSGEPVSRARATNVANDRRFPEPVVDHRKLRLWKRSEVLAWIDARDQERTDPGA